MTRRKICSLLVAIPLWIVTAAPVRADVTVKYQSDMKMGPIGGHAATSEKTLRDQVPRFTSVRMKNGKAWSAMGSLTHILDYATQQMTLLDTEHKTFIKLPVAELADQLSALMPKPQWPEPAKKMMEGIKSSVDSKKTGKTDTIAGIQAEETEIVMTFVIPGLPGGGGMKVVMQIWNPKPEETLRNQAIREFTGYNIFANRFMNPAGMMEKMFGEMPGFTDSFKPMYDAMSKNGAMLRTRMQMFMQMPPALNKADVDPSVPIIQMTQEAVEVSSVPVEESIFQIPADYQPIPTDVFLKGMLAAQSAISAK